MAQEEHTQRCSNSSSGGGAGGGGSGGSNGCVGGGGSSCRSSKKLKQKKVPQRGLGVAQLEKIRLEEQQKKDAAIQAVQCATNFRHNPSPSSIPLPPPSPSDLTSPNSMFRPTSSIPSIDVLHPSAVPFSKPSNGGGGEIRWPAILGGGEGNFPKLWNGESNLEGENHHGFTFGSNMNLPYESNPIWPPPNVMQRTQQFQQQTSSSMVNVSFGTSSLTVMNYHQMEPPSNQRFYGNNYIPPMWPEEEKMVGMKRPYPFSLDNPPGPSFPCKFPPYFPPITRPDDQSASCVNGSTVNVESINPVFREGSWSSTVVSELNPNKITKENGDLNGDFLTLAPPTTAQPHPGSKYKHPSVYLTPHIQELPEFESLPFQGCVENPIHQPGPSRSTQQQPFYSFLPSAKARIGQATTTASSCSGEVGENVDLNLKL